MVEFASRWPDFRLWAIGRCLVELAPGTSVSAERNEKLPAQVVVSAVPAQLLTPISRNVLITVETWAPGKSTALALCQDAIHAITSGRPDGVFVRLTDVAGPNENRDEAGVYFYSATATIIGRAA